MGVLSPVARLPLSLAIGEYDHVHDIVSGRVEVQGVSLTCLQFSRPEEAMMRLERLESYDVGEISMGAQVARLAAGDDRLIALPVFTSRLFRHSAIYVRDPDIARPQDLAGRTVGLPAWCQTAAIYVRGLLMHEYGLPVTSVQWVQAGLHESGRPDPFDPEPSAGISLRRVADRTLDELLLTGEIDAIISARPPASASGAHPSTRRLISDPTLSETAFYGATRIFPIMHALGVRRSVVEKNPWVAFSLVQAFEEAKNRSLARLRDRTASHVPLPWSDTAYDHAVQLMGEDYWPYGIAANHATLDAFLEYAHEQGIGSRQTELVELFPVDTSAACL